MTYTPMTRRLAAAAAASGLFAAYGVAKAQTTIQEVPHGTIFPVSFPMNSVELHQADHETIHGVAAMMQRDPKLVALVLGKADTVGSGDFNEHLSWRRASAVYEALVFKYGVPAIRVEMRWTGDRLPVAPTGDEKAELQNRVVNIVLQ